MLWSFPEALQCWKWLHVRGVGRISKHAREARAKNLDHAHICGRDRDLDLEYGR